MQRFARKSAVVLGLIAAVSLCVVCACTVDAASALSADVTMGAGMLAAPVMLGMAVDTGALSNALKKFATDAGTLSTDSATLDQKQKDASDAAAAATTQQNAVSADLATLQTDLDAVNAEGVKLGLKINVPGAPAAPAAAADVPAAAAKT